MTAPVVDNIRLEVTYSGRVATLDLNAEITPAAGIDTRQRLNEAVAELVRLVMEAV